MPDTPSLNDSPSLPPTQFPAPPRPASETNKVQNAAISICALGIIIAFFLPWTESSDRYRSLNNLFNVDSNSFAPWVLPILALAVLFLHKHPNARSMLGLWILGFLFLEFVYRGFQTHFMAYVAGWGMVLTNWFAVGLFAFTGERHRVRPLDLVAKKLGSRKASLNAYWGTMTPNVHFSSKEFYSEVENAIRDKQWPGVQMLRITYTEAGLLSHKREYLRVIRQRQLFDLCAATFGKDYFFSVREAELPVVLDPRSAFALTLGLLLFLFACFRMAGLIAGTFFFACALLFGAWFLFNLLQSGLTKLDSVLLQLPVIGVVYEAWFRRDTYFQQDSRLAFLQSVNDLIKKHVAEATSEKGLKYLNCLENQPVLEGLYKRSRMPLPERDIEPEPEPALT